MATDRATAPTKIPVEMLEVRLQDMFRPLCPGVVHSSRMLSNEGCSIWTSRPN